MELLTPEEKIRMAKKLIGAVPKGYEVLQELEEEVEKLSTPKHKPKKSSKKKKAETDEDDEKGLEIITENRDIKDFVGIDAAGCIDVHLSKGNEFKVIVTGRRKDINHIKTTLRKDILYITTDPLYGFGNATIVSCNNIVSVGRGVTVVNGQIITGNGSTVIMESIKVEVTMPKLQSLATSGSGDIYVESDFKTDGDATATVSGSGDIHLQSLECKGFGAAVKGSGNIHVGQLNAKDSLFAAVKGAGDIDIYNAYIAGDSELHIQGSGDIRVNGSTNNVSAYIVGSGDISGNLKYNNINSSCTGSGDIRLAGYYRKRNRFDW